LGTQEHITAWSFGLDRSISREYYAQNFTIKNLGTYAKSKQNSKTARKKTQKRQGIEANRTVVVP
jgi:hypothetical protein